MVCVSVKEVEVTCAREACGHWRSGGLASMATTGNHLLLLPVYLHANDLFPHPIVLDEVWVLSAVVVGNTEEGEVACGVVKP